MQWIWQQKKWPNFQFDLSLFSVYDKEFYKNAGNVIGVLSHLPFEDVQLLQIEILTQEAVSTSGIEGEILQRASVQSSIRKHLGLKTEKIKIPANAAGVAEMMSNVYTDYDKPLTHNTLFLLHKMLMNGRRDIEHIGNYRMHKDPMQIVSGNLSAPKLFYEAPPSSDVPTQMEIFVQWYNNQILNTELPVVVAAGIAHLYFEIIHPFEDGNGRIGRALIEKMISQKMKTPALNSFAKIIETNKKEYYDALQSSNNNLNISEWLIFFSKMLIQSQKYTISMVDFIILKTKFLLKFQNAINSRQIKVLLRIFEEGMEGFKEGLSAANYKTITSASAATVTRDLQELVGLKALEKKGELKYSRYFLNLKDL